MIEITQADRDAAERSMRNAIMRTGSRAEDFARHRIEERAKIVAWLRHKLDDWPDYVAPSDIADAIEAGEHLK